MQYQFKAMISGEHQKNCALEILFSIKQLILASSMLFIINIIKIFFTTIKDFSELVNIKI